MCLGSLSLHVKQNSNELEDRVFSETLELQSLEKGICSSVDSSFKMYPPYSIKEMSFDLRRIPISLMYFLACLILTTQSRHSSLPSLVLLIGNYKLFVFSLGRKIPLDEVSFKKNGTRKTGYIKQSRQRSCHRKILTKRFSYGLAQIFDPRGSHLRHPDGRPRWDPARSVQLKWNKYTLQSSDYPLSLQSRLTTASRSQAAIKILLIAVPLS